MKRKTFIPDLGDGVWSSTSFFPSFFCCISSWWWSCCYCYSMFLCTQSGICTTTLILWKIVVPSHQCNHRHTTSSLWTEHTPAHTVSCSVLFCSVPLCPVHDVHPVHPACVNNIKGTSCSPSSFDID